MFASDNLVYIWKSGREFLPRENITLYRFPGNQLYKFRPGDVLIYKGLTNHGGRDIRLFEFNDEKYYLESRFWLENLFDCPSYDQIINK